MDYNRFTTLLFIISVILLIFGILVFVAPKLLIRISEPLNKEIGKKKRSNSLVPDERVLQKRHVIGPVLVFIGIILLYYSYYLL